MLYFCGCICSPRLSRTVVEVMQLRQKKKKLPKLATKNAATKSHTRITSDQLETPITNAKVNMIALAFGLGPMLGSCRIVGKTPRQQSVEALRGGDTWGKNRMQTKS